MQIKRLASLLSLAALLAPGSAVQTPFNASFDNLQGSAAAKTEPVGVYYNISYSNFGVSQPGIDGESFTGVMPHTNPNDAIGFTSGASSISIAYPGSKVKSFALNSLYYGCGTALQQGEVDSAIACSITVTGYKAGSSKPAATQTFQFAPAQPIDLQNAPTFGSFTSAFQGLEYANFTFTPSTLVVLFIDNLVGSTQS